MNKRHLILPISLVCGMGAIALFSPSNTKAVEAEGTEPVTKTITLTADSFEWGQKIGENLSYVNGYGEIVYSMINNAVEFNSHGNNQNYKTAEYNIKKLIYDVQKIMLPVATDNSNSILVEFDSSIPDFLVGATEEIKRIIINLVCESLKNTHDGLITIGVSGRKIESDGMNLIISIEDNGVSMQRDIVRKLVQFNTKSKKWDKNIFDDGYFKIRIAKYLIERMHGKLHIDSEVDKGTKYTIVLPQEII